MIGHAGELAIRRRREFVGAWWDASGMVVDDSWETGGRCGRP